MTRPTAYLSMVGVCLGRHLDAFFLGFFPVFACFRSRFWVEIPKPEQEVLPISGAGPSSCSEPTGFTFFEFLLGGVELQLTTPTEVVGGTFLLVFVFARVVPMAPYSAFGW